METVAIIPAAGQGKRAKAELRKQFLPLNGKPVLAHTIARFEGVDAVNGVIVVAPKGLIRYCKEYIVEKYGFSKVFKVVVGGKNRQDSVRNGMDAIPEGCSIVLVHDGVRPLVSQEHIHESIEYAKRYGAAIVAVRARETIKVASDDLIVIKTLDREGVWLAQTPQVFRYQIIKDAYNLAYQQKFYGTDEAALVERLGIQIKIVEGSYRNIKITTREDIGIAETIMNMKGEGW